MAENTKFDLIVIGAGTGGLTAAEVAVRLGARVALVETSDRLGGECLHSGCVPSKALIHAARGVQIVQDHGAAVDTAQAYHQAVDNVRQSIAAIETAHDNDEYYQKMGVIVFHSHAKFSSKNSLVLDDGTELNAKKFIIATGSTPAIPSIPGLDSVPFLTNETVFKLTELPTSLTIIGGGPIGCELGQAFAMFGCKVTILSNGDRLLPRDEPEAAKALLKNFQANPNITLVFGAETIKVSNDGTITVDYKIGDDAKSVTSEQLLIATGRAANTALNLEAAGVTYDKRSVTTDGKLQTSNKSIYAIGDVAGGPYFTHVAADHASLAVQNALLGVGQKKRSLNELPWSTFTTPEVARVGSSEASLLTDNTAYKKHVLDFADIDKAITDREQGFIKILTTPRGKILGATIVGGPASELISTIAVAMKHGITIQKLGAVLQPYPTYAFGLKLFASDLSLQTYESGLKRKIVTLLRGLR